MVDAGIVLKDMIVACEAAVIEEGEGTALIDPNQVESSNSSIPQLSLALLPKVDKIVSMEVSGRLHLERLENSLSAARQGAKDMFVHFDNMVKKHLSNLNQTM